jgi:hypothetical protein
VTIAAILSLVVGFVGGGSIVQAVLVFLGVGAKSAATVEAALPAARAVLKLFTSQPVRDALGKIVKREPLTEDEHAAVARAHAQTLADPFGRMG